MSKERFALLNMYNFNDKFFDNENEKYLDSLDVVRFLNHYDKTLGEFIKRDVEQKDKISDLEAKLAESEKLIFTYQNIFKQKPETALEMCEFIQPYERKLGKQELEIKQLKQQLVEKDQAIENWQTMYQSVVQTCHNDAKEIERLNKQLADCEHTIDQYEHELEVYKHNDDLYANKIRSFANKNKQDKISFAVEQLEKVKEFVKETSGIVGHEWRIDRFRVLETIDDQIKAIKEKK